MTTPNLQDQEPTSAPLPSASIYGGAYWASSPSQVSFFAMLKAMELQMDAATAYAEYQEKIWDPNNKNSMYQTFLKEMKYTKEAMTDKAQETRFAAGESVGAAACSTVAAGGSFVPGGQEAKDADQAVKNTTAAQDQMKAIQNDPSRTTTGLGDDLSRSPGGARVPKGYEADSAKTDQVLERLKVQRFSEKDAVDLNHKPIAGGPSYKEALEVQNDTVVNEHAERINEQVDSAYARRNAAENARQRMGQMITSLTGVAQGANTSAMKFCEAEKEKEQGDDNANTTAARAGKETMDKICQTDADANHTAVSNASQILGILANMEKAG